MESRIKTTSIDHGPMGMLILWAFISMTWWLLAFWPITPSVEQSWVARAQYVCFGKLAGQALPLSGWILLFGGPTLLLAALLIVYNSEILETWRFRKQNKIIASLFLVLAVAFGLEVLWVGYRVHQESASNVKVIDTTAASNQLPADYPTVKEPLPAFSLIDQWGKKVTPATLRGKTVLFSFVFAHCAAVCPMLVRQINGALKDLDPEKTLAVLITLDPWRDRPSGLAKMAKEWELPTNAHYLSGDIDEVVKVHELFKLNLDRDKKSGDVAHPALVYVVNPRGETVYKFNNPQVSWLIEAAKRTQAQYGNE